MPSFHDRSDYENFGTRHRKARGRTVHGGKYFCGLVVVSATVTFVGNSADEFVCRPSIRRSETYATG